MTRAIPHIVGLTTILFLAAIALTGCAPRTLELPPIANPSWP